jgi:hypothetical protein
MTERIYIKPVPQPEGQQPLKVRKPVNGHLAVDGEWVNRDSYWLRRLNDGDVVEAEAPAEPEPAPAVPEAPAEPAAASATVAAKPRGGKS